jgi:hypothetical protein
VLQGEDDDTGSTSGVIGDACRDAVLQFRIERNRNINSNMPLGEPPAAACCPMCEAAAAAAGPSSKARASARPPLLNNG